MGTEKQIVQVGLQVNAKLKKTGFLLLIGVLWMPCAIAQAKFTPGRLLHSADELTGKEFYLVTLREKNWQGFALIASDKFLSAYFKKKKETIKAHVNDTCKTVKDLLSGFRFANDTTDLLAAMGGVYDRHRRQFDRMIDHELKPSGCYYRFNARDNKTFYLNSWRELFKGINTIISHYGYNEGFRYPDIDSASYNTKSQDYRDLIKTMFSYLDEKTGKMTLFYEPSLTIAMQLMAINERDESARYEPLESGENQKAVQRIKRIKWQKYPYSAILVPGEGPDIASVQLAPAGKMRCDLAAARYQKGLAPFLIVSGGHVHPFHTPYCEAIEMKKYLMKEGVPESSIILEPQARHTTTNFRNAERLMMRYGFPINKPALCVSTKDQEDYIEDPRFDKRNKKELDYVPYRDKHRLANHEISFYPVMESLQINPNDPLDP